MSDKYIYTPYAERTNSYSEEETRAIDAQIAYDEGADITDGATDDEK